jgi:hypothetical protein
MTFGDVKASQSMWQGCRQLKFRWRCVRGSGLHACKACCNMFSDMYPYRLSETLYWLQWTPGGFVTC